MSGDAVVQTDTKKTLQGATVQELQLELIRRTRFNSFDGERIVRWLTKHRKLWQAVILDRIATGMAGRLPPSGLIKLRDLPHNLWNADTLYILCPTVESAERLSKLSDEEDWGGMAYVYSKPDDVDNALGSGRETRAILRIWWD